MKKTLWLYGALVFAGGIAWRRPHQRTLPLTDRGGRTGGRTETRPRPRDARSRDGTVTASEFVVLDAAGKERAKIDVNDDGQAGFAMYDRDNHPRAQIVIDNQGAAERSALRHFQQTQDLARSRHRWNSDHAPDGQWRSSASTARGRCRGRGGDSTFTPRTEKCCANCRSGQTALLVRACRALAKIEAPRYVDSNTQPALRAACGSGRAILRKGFGLNHG